MHACNIVRGLSGAAGLVSLILLVPSSPLHAADPVFLPEMTITSTHLPISIDGVLGDPGWRGAAHTNSFVEFRPGDNLAPEVPTDVFVTYNDENLFIAFLCQDDPAALHSTLCQRDQAQGDDQVIVLLDTYGTGSWAYEFFVNPYGVQKDQLWNVSGPEDVGFDLLWKSAAHRTDSGYQVEIAIPFTSLRFPDQNVQTWRIDFWRERPRESQQQYAWAAKDRNQQCFPCQFGTIHGIHDVRPGRGIELLPSFVGYHNGERLDRHRFKEYQPEGQLSLGGKYRISSNVTVEASANPDFSQIEADATQIDVNSTFALFFPERRPFFQEGSDIFQTMFNSFYTRTVADPSFAAKVTGRLPRTSFGLFTAVDENSPYLIPIGQLSLPTFNSGRSLVNVFRGVQSFGSNAQAGIMLSDRRFQHGGAGSILSGDYVVRLSNVYAIDGQYLLSYTGEMDNPSLTAPFGDFTFDHDRHTVAFDGETYWGSAFIQRFRRTAEHLNINFDYDQVSPSYRTHTGYDPVNNHRSVNLFTSYSFLPKGGLFERIQPGNFTFRRWDFDGGRLQEFNDLNLNLQLRYAQTEIFLQYRDRFEAFAGIPFDNLHTVRTQVTARPHRSLSLNLTGYTGTGIAYFLPTPVAGGESGADLQVTLKPIDRLTLDSRLQYYRITDQSADTAYADGYIARTRIQYQFAKELSLRLVAEYNDFSQSWNIDPLLTYRLSPFSVFYAGTTLKYDDWSIAPNDPHMPVDWKLSRRQFFVKLQYLFQG